MPFIKLFLKSPQHFRHHLKTEQILTMLDYNTAAATAKSPQSCLTLCDPIDGSPPGCPIPGILQARTLEWVAISFSNAWKWKVKVKSLSHVRLLATPWTAAYQPPPSMGFSRQEYCSGVPLPSPVHLLRDKLINLERKSIFSNLKLCYSLSLFVSYLVHIAIPTSGQVFFWVVLLI